MSMVACAAGARRTCAYWQRCSALHVISSTVVRQWLRAAVAGVTRAARCSRSSRGWNAPDAAKSWLTTSGSHCTTAGDSDRKRSLTSTYCALCISRSTSLSGTPLSDSVDRRSTYTVLSACSASGAPAASAARSSGGWRARLAVAPRRMELPSDASVAEPKNATGASARALASKCTCAYEGAAPGDGDDWNENSDVRSRPPWNFTPRTYR
mmetsp:Transcript_41652/g.102481  ORF Transcript_41652/g.102481 Transcript_41652/m.102481 type:complete len:210 (-) Transcript_41652:516-1145(-)